VIYVKGCLEKGEEWFQQYMIPVAGVVVGAAVVLVTVHDCLIAFLLLGLC